MEGGENGSVVMEIVRTDKYNIRDDPNLHVMGCCLVHATITKSFTAINRVVLMYSIERK